MNSVELLTYKTTGSWGNKCLGADRENGVYGQQTESTTVFMHYSLQLASLLLKHPFPQLSLISILRASYPILIPCL